MSLRHVSGCLIDTLLAADPCLGVDPAADRIRVSVAHIPDPEGHGDLHLRQAPDGLPLAHPSHCPLRALAPELSAAALAIKVAVSVLPISADGFVLLTRRAAHMRTFPLVWVTPGGGVDAGEDLVSAALRELAEETGVQLSNTAAVVTPLCLFESSFPVHLAHGQPVRRHVVWYATVQLPQPAAQISLVLQAAEVDFAAWFSVDMVRRMVQPATSAAEVAGQYLAMAVGAELVDVPRELGPLLSQSDLDFLANPDVERLSTGTRFALKEYLGTLPVRAS